MSTTSVTDDETCVLALIWTSAVELELFCVGGMSCNREVLCGGIIEDSWDGCSPRTELVIMSPITCFSFDETRWYTATDEEDLCLVTAIICAIEQFLPRIVAPVARIEWLVSICERYILIFYWRKEYLCCSYNRFEFKNSI